MAPTEYGSINEDDDITENVQESNIRHILTGSVFVKCYIISKLISRFFPGFAMWWLVYSKQFYY